MISSLRPVHIEQSYGVRIHAKIHQKCLEGYKNFVKYKWITESSYDKLRLLEFFHVLSCLDLYIFHASSKDPINTSPNKIVEMDLKWNYLIVT